MNRKEYINEVISRLQVSRKIKKRVREDLESRIDEAFNYDPYYNIVEDMGSPTELASEFMENFEKPGEQIWGYVSPYEYKSERTLFGVPLIHINTSGSSSHTSYAKGIIAIGDAAVGIVSIGGVSIGVFSVGGVSIGLLALGGVAIGGLALGGVAIGAYALGGVAISIIKGFGAVSLMFK